jgi:hypothetical protein
MVLLFEAQNRNHIIVNTHKKIEWKFNFFIFYTFFDVHSIWLIEKFIYLFENIANF